MAFTCEAGKVRPTVVPGALHVLQADPIKLTPARFASARAAAETAACPHGNRGS